MQAAARPTTIIDIVVPGTGIVRDLALVASFTLFVAVFAQIAIRLPFTPVPITGQTLAVLVTGGALGANRGAASLALYALIGSIGVPLFAPSAAALEGELIHFVLPWEGTGDLIWSLTSGGYIVGFIAAAYVVGRLAERGWDRGWKVTVAMLIGNVLVYVPGLLWLGYKIESFDNALVFGLYPFIVGDLIKLYVAAIALPGAWAIIGRRG
jgi:biotin transport system substrate-specific component